MKYKRWIWIGLWISTIVAMFIVSLVNYRPYFIMGGSTSVLNMVDGFMQKYPENHKKIDFTYNALGSSAAPPRVQTGMFGIGWLSEDYPKPDPTSNFREFVISTDGVVIVYNLPDSAFQDSDFDPLTHRPKPLDFNPINLQALYLHNKTWAQAFPDQIKADYNHSPILYTRSTGSGTRNVFDQKGLGGATYYPARQAISSQSMLSIADDAIGYVSYADTINGFPPASNPQLNWGAWENMADGKYYIISEDNIKNKVYTLTRPFTGLINTHYKYLSTLVPFLKWIFDDNSAAAQILKNTGQVKMPITDPINQDFKTWLDLNSPN